MDTLDSRSDDDVDNDGCFSWIRVFMRVTEKQIRLKCGENAFHYIRFQKHILFYSVIIFGLSIGIILQVNNSGTNEPVKDSFGTTTVSNLIANSNIFWCHTVFAILYTVIMVIVLRKFSEKLEFESHNDSKKTSMMTNVPKNVTSELINQHFREIYGESQVLDVQVAFDFVKLKQAKRKVLAAQMGREHCEELLRKTRERPLTTVTTNKLSPCCHCCGSSHVDGIEYFTEEEEKGKVEVDQHRQELKSLGIAFVTFKNAENVERCLGDFNTKSESSVSRRDFLDNAKVSKAPLPGDIIWEHLSADNKNFCFRAWPINTALFIFVLFFTTPTVALSTLQELKAIIVKSNPKLAVPPNPFFTQFVPTILLWSFAAILPAVVSGSSYCEAHWKRSKLEHSVMIKTYIFLMLMLIILPSLTLTSADALFHLTLGGRLPEFQSRLACVFLPNNGAFFVNYLVTSALIGTALELCRFPELVSYGGSMVLARNEGEKRLVRKEAVRDFAYGRQYAWMLVIFTMMVVYSLTCPLVTPFGLLYLAMKHLVDRYNLYFNYRPAADNHVDNKVHYIAMTFAVFSTFFLFLSLFSYSFIRLGFNDPHTVFTLCITFGTLLLLIARVCFGMFKKCGPQKGEYNLRDSDERHIPEAYLPPALRTTREMKATGSGSDSVSPPRLSKPKTYGTTANDQVTFADEEGR